MKFYFDKNASLKPLKGKTIAVLGFGSQGSAQAKCMKDSGLKVIIGLRKNSKSAPAAKKHGFKVFTVREAVKRADIVHVLVPDEVQAKVYKKEIAPVMNSKKALSFSHGFNIVFGKIVPPPKIDVFMIVPHAPGPAVRGLFLQKKGVPALFAVFQNNNGRAKKFALAMAKGCGFTREGVYESTFRQETFSDLFGEQAVLCGGLSELVKKGFETLVEAGYPKELAFYSTAFEIKLIAKLIAEHGIEGMWQKVSNTAEYGGRTRGPKLIGPGVKKRMKKMLKEIESEKFAREWLKEYEKGLPTLSRLRKKGKQHKIEKAANAVP